MVLDVSNTVWTLALADLSAFVDGPHECLDRVYGYERPSVAAKVLWQIPPSSFSCMVLWTWSRMDSTVQSTTSWPASRLHLHLRSWLPLCICHASVQSKCAWDVSSAARARACVRELWGLTPDKRPELGPFVSGEYLRKRMNASGVIMTRVCPHASITKHLLNSISSFKTRLPGDPSLGTGLGLWRHGRSGRRGGARARRPTPASRWHATWCFWTAMIYEVTNADAVNLPLLWPW